MTHVLIVTTSHDRFQGANPHPTGVWLEEFAVPYIELLKQGVDVTIVSPKGGEVPIDPRSAPTPEQEQAWQTAIAAVKQTGQLADVNSEAFDAIFLPGGHGPMFDLPENPDLQRLLREFHAAGKIIAAVCHGPVGLVNATLADGTPLVKGKVLTSYTYSEEVAAKLDQEVPFILEHRLRELGADFIAGANKADHVEHDGNLITGQNPNSSSSVAHALVAALNHWLPPIFTATPEAIVPAQTVAEFPVNTFLENIAINQAGELFVTSYEEGKIYHVTPAGAFKAFAQIGGNAAGIAFDRQGNLLVAGVTDDKTPAVFQIGQDGAAIPIVMLPDALFLNGMTYLTTERYLIADSFKGAIWEVNIAEKTARLWLQHERLARSEAEFPPFPGANGLKMYGNTLYVSNTQRQQLIRIPLNSDFTPGTPELVLTNVNLDDFAFDTQGNLYAATHVYNSLVKITPDGQITTIAKAEQGMTGNTALAFGRTAADQTAVYITTNGGMSLPSATGVEPAKVVRLEIGIPGLVFGE
ncbi:MAG: DJ-1/PfpI family protein [Lyngbya sp. HA4199-MV5]|nr:DJ-1/PfpI family protein [Lyngbya sp. HA4199-MV5]